MTGCTLVTDSFVNNEFSGDPFPTGVDLSTGAVMVGLRKEGIVDRPAVVDVLSPITVFDPGLEADGTIAPPLIDSATLTLLGKRPGTGALDLPRAQFPGKQIISLHPCATEPCTVGPAGADQRFGAVLGADALAGDAVRLRLGDQQMFVLADVAGTDVDHTYECDAVFPEPFRGGGELLVEGTPVPFGGRRVALQVCLAPDPDPALAQSARGTDILAVQSTGIGISLIGASAYERYRQAHPTAPVASTLTAETAVLSSGPITGGRVVIDSLVLVGDSDAAPRAPCRQVYAHHLLAAQNCEPGIDCPCATGDRFCSVPGMVEVAPTGGLPFLVVPDNDPTLSSLRTELRPDQPEVDAILGTSAIGAVEMDIDYPHNRVLARCSGPTCNTRPGISSESRRDRVNLCIAESGDGQSPLPTVP